MIGSKLFIRCHATSDPRLGYNILYTFWLHGVPLLTIVCFLFNMSRHFVSTNRYRNNDALKINHGICLDTQHFQFQNHIITNRSMQAKLYWVLLFGQFKQHCRFSSKYFGIHWQHGNKNVVSLTFHILMIIWQLLSWTHDRLIQLITHNQPIHIQQLDSRFPNTYEVYNFQ